jgi:hypothetical protein
MTNALHLGEGILFIDHAFAHPATAISQEFFQFVQ